MFIPLVKRTLMSVVQSINLLLQMLRAGKTKPQTEVVRKLTDVGGAVGGDVGSDDEDGAAAPSFQSSFGDAMTRALDRLEKDGKATSCNLIQPVTFVPLRFKSFFSQGQLLQWRRVRVERKERRRRRRCCS